MSVHSIWFALSILVAVLVVTPACSSGGNQVQHPDSPSAQKANSGDPEIANLRARVAELESRFNSYQQNDDSLKREICSLRELLLRVAGPSVSGADGTYKEAAATSHCAASTPPGAQTESGRRTYLQLSATNHDAAEIMVELLRKKRFPALAVERPDKPGLFRVLVGPIDEGEIDTIRAQLDNASFPGREALKRTF